MQGSPALVLREGYGQSVEQLNEECRAELLEVAQRHMAALAGSRSLWLPFLAVIVAECSDDVTAALMQVV
jgi:hypothetical protein